MNCDEGMRQILRKYGGAISGWLLGAESNTLVCWMSLAKLRIFNNRWRHLSNLKIPAKKISVMCDWHLLPRIQLQWTFSLLWYLICRCLKLQKSVFLQLLITKVGIMMGPALDRTGLFSSYILRCSCVSLRRLSSDFATDDCHGFRADKRTWVEKRFAWVVAGQVRERLQCCRPQMPCLNLMMGGKYFKGSLLPFFN